MVVHWWRTRGPNWQTSIFVNGLGAFLTTIILVIIAVTKFALGAWIVIVLIPFIVAILLFIHTHYTHVADQLRIVPENLPLTNIEHVVIVPIDDVNYASLRAIIFARTIARRVIVLHLSTSEERTDKIRAKVAKYAPDAQFIVVDSPYRAFVRPLEMYIEALHSQRPSAFVSLVIPEFITAHWWEKFLHNRNARNLREAFETHPNVAVIQVPYLLEE